MVDPAAPYLMLGRLTQADITAFVAERLARFGLNVDTARQMPSLHAHTRKLGEEPRLPLDRALGSIQAAAKNLAPRPSLPDPPWRRI